MASRWDGKIGKIPKISDKREGKRFSPRLTGAEPEFHECRQADEDYQRSDNGTLRSPGAADLYTPETVGQYKSQWARYERALSLNPAGIIQQGKKVFYKFESCDSITGFWEVEVSSGATYLNILKPVLQILCPRPIIMDMIESDGETFTWTQTRGKRTAELNGIFLKASVQSPPFGFEPQLDILSFCLDGNGCSDDSVEPIVLNVQPEGQPELFDSIIIYTTPTSTFYGTSYQLGLAAPDAEPCRQVPGLLPPGAPAPKTRQSAYRLDLPPDTFSATWSLPNCQLDFLVETVWQVNRTGQYETVARFPKDAIRFFSGDIETHYRILSVFDTQGHIATTESQRFYFTNGSQLILGDDSFDGISYNTYNNHNTLLLGKIQYEFNDTCDGISFNAAYSTSNSLPLGKVALEAKTDSYDGISFTSNYQQNTSYDLGGMIIR